MVGCFRCWVGCGVWDCKFVLYAKERNAVRVRKKELAVIRVPRTGGGGRKGDGRAGAM